MAKRGILEHPKTLDLAERLGIMEPFAVGLLEVFWQWVAKYHPRGDVTGTRPRILASSIRYKGDADALWQALIDSEFIDVQKDQTIVHDWSEHADDAVRKRLKLHGETFADGAQPYARKFGHDRETVAPESRQTREKVESESRKSERSACLPLPLPLPEPEPEPEPKEKTLAPSSPSPAGMEAVLGSLPPKIAKHVGHADPRFSPFKEALGRYWIAANGDLAMPWDGSEAKRLYELLRAMPKLDLGAFERMLANRARSDVSQSTRPRAWLASITDYACGPLDRYGKLAQAAAPHPEAAIGTHITADADLERIVAKAEDELAIQRNCDPNMPWPTDREVVAAALRFTSERSPELEMRLLTYVRGLTQIRQRLAANEAKARHADAEVHTC